MGTKEKDRPEDADLEDEDMSPEERADFEEEVVQGGDQRDQTNLEPPVVAPD